MYQWFHKIVILVLDENGRKQTKAEKRIIRIRDEEAWGSNPHTPTKERMLKPYTRQGVQHFFVFCY